MCLFIFMDIVEVPIFLFQEFPHWCELFTLTFALLDMSGGEIATFVFLDPFLVCKFGTSVK